MAVIDGSDCRGVDRWRLLRGAAGVERWSTGCHQWWLEYFREMIFMRELSGFYGEVNIGDMES